MHGARREEGRTSMMRSVGRGRSVRCYELLLLLPGMMQGNRHGADMGRMHTRIAIRPHLISSLYTLGTEHGDEQTILKRGTNFHWSLRTYATKSRVKEKSLPQIDLIRGTAKRL